MIKIKWALVATMMIFFTIQSNADIKVGTTFFCGHSASECTGAGACWSYGPWAVLKVHIPCTGKGKNCEWNIEVSIPTGTRSKPSPDTPYIVGITVPGYTEEIFHYAE